MNAELGWFLGLFHDVKQPLHYCDSLRGTTLKRELGVHVCNHVANGTSHVRLTDASKDLLVKGDNRSFRLEHGLKSPIAPEETEVFVFRGALSVEGWVNHL